MIHITLQDDSMLVSSRHDLPGGAIGDSFLTVTPGQHIGDLSYEQLRELGSGQHDIDFIGSDSKEKPGE